MEILLVVFVFFLNLGISYLNAKGCGWAWAETKAHGGWPRFFIWMVAIMAASGFIWCYLIVEVALLYAFGLFTLTMVKATLYLGYIIVIPGVILSGIVITIDSWARSYREGGILNHGVTAWNTYAQIHNTYNAISGMGDAFGFLGEAFSGDSEDALTVVGIFMVCLAVLSALLLGILTTRGIILRTAGNTRLLSVDEMRARR